MVLIKIHSSRPFQSTLLSIPSCSIKFRQWNVLPSGIHVTSFSRFLPPHVWIGGARSSTTSRISYCNWSPQLYKGHSYIEKLSCLFRQVKSWICGRGFVSMEEGCVTPRHGGCRIPATLQCPPPPKKKPLYLKQREPPKESYFQPPDLEVLFAMKPRRKACA